MDYSRKRTVEDAASKLYCVGSQVDVIVLMTFVFVYVVIVSLMQGLTMVLRPCKVICMILNWRSFNGYGSGPQCMTPDTLLSKSVAKKWLPADSLVKSTHVRHGRLINHFLEVSLSDISCQVPITLQVILAQYPRTSAHILILHPEAWLVSGMETPTQLPCGASAGGDEVNEGKAVRAVVLQKTYLFTRNSRDTQCHQFPMYQVFAIHMLNVFESPCNLLQDVHTQLKIDDAQKQLLVNSCSPLCQRINAQHWRSMSYSRSWRSSIRFAVSSGRSLMRWPETNLLQSSHSLIQIVMSHSLVSQIVSGLGPGVALLGDSVSVSFDQGATAQLETVKQKDNAI